MSKTADLALLAMVSAGLVGACAVRTDHPPADPLATPPAAETPKALKSRRTHAGLHNVWIVTEGLISGSQPDGDPGFNDLAEMGVRTIISVDGARPDIERASAHGMRYVHLPIGYGGIEPARTRQLARAVRDLPKPVYLHCHHGRHRGPAAAAIAAVALGRLNNKDAVDFMKRARTSPDYAGLYACVERAPVETPASLATVSTDFPQIATVSGLIRTMASVDRAYDNLKRIRDAGWTTPPDHPDLIPAAEARQVGDRFTGLLGEAETQNKTEEFRYLLGVAAASAGTLTQALSANSRDDLPDRFSALASSCKDCHIKYRD